MLQQLQSQRSLHGFVTDEKGVVIAGARVVVEGFSREVLTAPGGDYWKLLPPNTYTVSVSASGFYSTFRVRLQ